MRGVARMYQSRVSSDDRVDARCLADFYGDGRLALARVSTHCRKVLRVAMHGCGDQRN